jgi:anti-sigma factor RsiW
MKAESLNDCELEAYLDEALPAETMSGIEEAIRATPELARRLVAINGRRDSGVHSLGDIWRRHRLTCPNRSEIGSFLLGVLPDAQARYIRFHTEVIGCRSCAANLADLKHQQAEAADTAAVRRRKYFESSAGYLRRPGS